MKNNLIASSALGIILGTAVVITRISFIYAPWPAHGPISVVGPFYVLFGILIIFGCILVLKKKTIDSCCQ